MKVEFYKHNIGSEEKESILRTLDSLFLTTGPVTKKFEEEFANYLGVKYCTGLYSCTSALFLALKAWDIGPGDLVIVPAMTFIATANAVLHTGAEVLFCDVDAKTSLIDINIVESLLQQNNKVKAIIPVHLYGQMVDMKSLKEVSDKYGVRLLEDCAHCIEGEREGYKPGKYGDAAAFSFYATKNMASGEGGALVYNDEEMDNKIKIMRLHGMSKSALTRHENYQHWDMEIMGYKANMFDIQASLLLPQLKKIDDNLKIRESICRNYESEFLKSGIEFPAIENNVKSARHLFTIWAPLNQRDRYLEYLQTNGIGVAVNYRAVHLRSYYMNKYNFNKGSFPIAEEIGDRTLSIPLYTKLTTEEIKYIIDKVLECKEIIN
jgi:dTDP-4-amino-4,6-dideoxygalactose transaminase